VKLYELATTLDEFDGSYPPDDTGSSGLAVSKAAMKMGYISGYKHAFSTTNALRALMLTTLIMGINWYETMDYPNPDTGKVEVYGEIRGGHEVQIKGFHESTTSDPYDGLLECCNSWGKGWGMNGKFYLTVHDYERLMGEDGDTTILMK
jgi:C1A family cysteine protease